MCQLIGDAFIDYYTGTTAITSSLGKNMIELWIGPRSYTVPLHGALARALM